jgi:hypothetical protein
MMMRTVPGLTAALLVAASVIASAAGAVDIRDRWGIGAGVFGGGGEVSLIRGRSERSAWLFDVAVKQRSEAFETVLTPPQPASASPRNNDVISILAGPGYRRFTRPAEEFSPYWDVHARGTYAHSHYGGPGSQTQTGAGVEAELSFGLEYFTRWHFSVAAHSSLVRLSWAHLNQRLSLAGVETRTTGHSEDASIGLSPAIYVRGYF